MKLVIRSSKVGDKTRWEVSKEESDYESLRDFLDASAFLYAETLLISGFSDEPEQEIQLMTAWCHLLNAFLSGELIRPQDVTTTALRPKKSVIEA